MFCIFMSHIGSAILASNSGLEIQKPLLDTWNFNLDKFQRKITRCALSRQCHGGHGLILRSIASMLTKGLVEVF